MVSFCCLSCALKAAISVFREFRIAATSLFIGFFGIGLRRTTGFSSSELSMDFDLFSFETWSSSESLSDEDICGTFFQTWCGPGSWLILVGFPLYAALLQVLLSTTRKHPRAHVPHRLFASHQHRTDANLSRKIIKHSRLTHYYFESHMSAWQS